MHPSVGFMRGEMKGSRNLTTERMDFQLRNSWLPYSNGLTSCGGTALLNNKLQRDSLCIEAFVSGNMGVCGFPSFYDGFLFSVLNIGAKI